MNRSISSVIAMPPPSHYSKMIFRHLFRRKRRSIALVILGLSCLWILNHHFKFISIFRVKYVPDKNKVDDMCLFANVIENFSGIKDCDSKRAENSTWQYDCKIQCPSQYPWENPRITSKTIRLTCKHKILENIRSFMFNETCFSKEIGLKCSDDTNLVPNIVHYVWLGDRKQFQFYNFLSVYSVHKYQKPCVILFHGETLPYGPYWEKTLKVVKNIIHVYRPAPATVYGKKIIHIEHKADIVRLRLLQEYGGIYFDTDTILIRSLDTLRGYKYSMSMTRDDTLGNGLILSSKNADFVNIWLSKYTSFNPKKWGEHSVYLPYKLSLIHKDIIHVENRTFLHGGTLDQIFMSNFKWNRLYALHLYIRYYTKCIYNEHSIPGLNTTLGSVARHVLFDSKDLCTTTRINGNIVD